LRLDKLEKIRENSNLKNIVIMGDSNLFYFTGYRGMGTLLYCDRVPYLVVPALERNRAEKTKGLEVRSYFPVRIAEDLIEGGMFEAIETLCKGISESEVGLDVRSLSAELYNSIRDKWKIKDISSEISSIRSIKDEEELDKIRKAHEITAKAMNRALEEFTKGGVTELNISGLIDFTMKEMGAEEYAFPSIVAFGENSAEPHHIPSLRRLKASDNAVVDIGARFEGYCFDSTRTFLPKFSYEELRKVYEAVLEAQLEAIDLVRDSVEASEVDKMARSRIQRAGYERFFIHSTGHGVGIDVHEAPLVSMKSKDILKENMVITVEPGIYIKDRVGVRIEDTIIVKKGKPEVLETLYKFI